MCNRCRVLSFASLFILLAFLPCQRAASFRLSGTRLLIWAISKYHAHSSFLSGESHLRRIKRKCSMFSPAITWASRRHIKTCLGVAWHEISNSATHSQFVPHKILILLDRIKYLRSLTSNFSRFRPILQVRF